VCSISTQPLVRREKREFTEENSKIYLANEVLALALAIAILNSEITIARHAVVILGRATANLKTRITILRSGIAVLSLSTCQQ
jgi:hypothetical protein